ncbi:hypothetical protein GCK72_012411 [Caenorhabditis remanei]|uniref:Uncharacterized protein n=1 Tax=Caenorhabditis remanei TaxID=31234 RepID=A0A6A5GKV5_CAERE|nr:hypothetical protein GCK72_012411 [Caenorhabditis remanei]KAF1755958.1 hypothetical protein GCK72_012411 [Caenorhabditis remanei]
MKATGLYLLVAVIPVLVNSCLVVKSPPCTCPIAVLDWSNIDQFAGQSWYDYVVQRALTTPTIKPFENNCGTYIHCPRPYTLYDAEFVDVNDKRRPTQAVGHCDQKTNTWNVTDGLISHETTKWSPICVDESSLEFYPLQSKFPTFQRKNFALPKLTPLFFLHIPMIWMQQKCKK